MAVLVMICVFFFLPETLAPLPPGTKVRPLAPARCVRCIPWPLPAVPATSPGPCPLWLLCPLCALTLDPAALLNHLTPPPSYTAFTAPPS